MATTQTQLKAKAATILALLLISLHSQKAFSTPDTDTEDEDDVDQYVLDTPFASSHRLRSRFLASIKKGTTCDPKKKNLCNGVLANEGTSLLYCCKTHCRNIYGDRNNCGRCENKCRLGELCCHGKCTNVYYSTSNCGQCDKSCASGHRCTYGFCGYA